MQRVMQKDMHKSTVKTRILLELMLSLGTEDVEHQKGTIQLLSTTRCYQEEGIGSASLPKARPGFIRDRCGLI